MPATSVWLRSLLPFVVMCFGGFMALLDIQIVASSLQQIGGGLSAAQDQIAWVQTAYPNIYAKAEGIETRRAFRDAFERRRCLVPVDNFYEWKKTETGKQPYAIALADRGIMALAGLWENWKSSAGEWVRSFAIVATEPNELCARLHNRMPVVLAPETWPAWLGEEAAEPAQLKSLLVPYPSDGMVAWPVSPLVGSVRNNDPSLIEPIVLP
jgi:putative SOS response-associated peptidase YedK